MPHSEMPMGSDCGTLRAYVVRAYDILYAVVLALSVEEARVFFTAALTNRHPAVEYLKEDTDVSIFTFEEVPIVSYDLRAKRLQEPW